MVEAPPTNDNGLEGIHVVQSLGQGAYGEVHLGFYSDMDQWVAIKELDIEFITR
jgi:serine/threonine protein kinase